MMWWSALSRLLLPPGSLVLLGLAGLLLWRWRPARWLGALAMICLYALSTPLVSYALVAPLERQPALDPDSALARDAQAVVVLGGGRRPLAPEYGGDTVGHWTLERVRYAAHLHRMLDIPLLVSGGTPDAGRPSEARLMRESLERDFSVAVRWEEPRSRNTWENANESAAMLRQDGVTRILLVTTATHMSRSVNAFDRAGLESVAPAPTHFLGRPEDEPRLHPLAVFPDRMALLRSSVALHEYLGHVWYALHYR